jgi:hypothetical protein
LPDPFKGEEAADTGRSRRVCRQAHSSAMKGIHDRLSLVIKHQRHHGKGICILKYISKKSSATGNVFWLHAKATAIWLGRSNG